jgi:SAM-dependent methyltransferase
VLQMPASVHSCPVCESICSRVLMAGCIDRLHGCPGEWRLMECGQCGLISLYPWPTNEEIGSFYPSGYQPYRPTKSLLTNRLVSTLRRMMIAPYSLRFGSPGMERPPLGAGRLLEVGCGAGVFLKNMSDLGWNATGIDISPLALEAARSNAPNALLLLGTLESAALEGPYDLIVMQHVLEHIAYPAKCLAKCFDLLAPSGALYIAIPNIDSFEANAFSRYWSGLDVPRHLVHFRESVLTNLLEQCGYEVEGVRPQLMPSNLSESLLFLMSASLRRTLMRSRGAQVLYLISIFPAAVSYMLGNRGVLEIRARKRAHA